MAIGATIYTFTVNLADVDRGVYEELSVRVARHQSETDAFMLTRVIAYSLEFEEGIAFSEGISATDEPAVLVRDLTGALTAWIEVGAPDAARLHSGSMQAARTAVYTHRDPAKVAAPWAGKRIHRGDEIPLYSFDPGLHRRRRPRGRAPQHDDALDHRAPDVSRSERHLAGVRGARAAGRVASDEPRTHRRHSPTIRRSARRARGEPSGAGSPRRGALPASLGAGDGCARGAAERGC